MSTSLPIPDALGQHLRGPGREQKEAEMNCETVHFRTNSQSVSLHPSGEEIGVAAHPPSGTGLLGPQLSAVFLSLSLTGQNSAHCCLSF